MATLVGIISSDPIADVAARVGAALGVELHQRESSFLGDPYYSSPPPDYSLKLTENRDPVYLPGDPPDEIYFAPAAPDCRYVLWCDDEWDAKAPILAEQLRDVRLEARVAGECE